VADRGKAGMQLGSNVLEYRFEKGGNSEVWSARSGDQGTVVKILRRDEANRIRRFLDEIAFHDRYKDDGVLPLLESDSEGTIKWFSMPPAKKVRDALAKDWSPQRVTETVGVYAETLARLAAQGVSHRDLKPENLFVLNDRPVIGDFGLVDFPEKDEITDASELMGPLHYHAPETLTDPLGADGKAADVWSLGKTLWVLLTGQTFPLPGEHRRGVPYDLGDWVNHPHAAALDDLIIHCTRFAPTNRPPMQNVAEALKPPTIEPAELRDDATREEIQERFMAVTQSAVDAANEAEDLNRRLTEMDIALTLHVGAVEIELDNLFAGRFQHHPSDADYAGMRFGRDYGGRTYRQFARNAMLYMPIDGRLKIVHSVRVDLIDPAGRMLLYGYFALIEHFGHRDEPLVYRELPSLSVSLGSAEFQDALNRFHAVVDGCLDEVVKKATVTLTRPKSEAPAWFQSVPPQAADGESPEGALETAAGGSADVEAEG